jgi:sRNA-binding regulator protein Hfq
LVYFVETKDGSKTQISLMNGIKQRGVMHSTDEHMVYKFRISHLMKEDIEIRLHAENG